MNTQDTIEKYIEEFVEKGADIEHRRWARWQEYMHSKLVYNEGINPDTGHTEAFYVLPADYYERWERQIDTSYADLSEAEKESDRKEVREYANLFRTTLTAVDKEAEARGFARGQLAEVEANAVSDITIAKEKVEQIREEALDGRKEEMDKAYEAGRWSALEEVKLWAKRLAEDSKENPMRFSTTNQVNEEYNEAHDSAIEEVLAHLDSLTK